MNAYTGEIRDFQEYWHQSLKARTQIDLNTVTTDGNRGPAGDFLRPNDIFKRVTEPLIIDGQLADGGLVSEDFAL